MKYLQDNSLKKIKFKHSNIKNCQLLLVIHNYESRKLDDYKLNVVFKVLK